MYNKCCRNLSNKQQYTNCASVHDVAGKCVVTYQSIYSPTEAHGEWFKRNI